MRSLIACLFLSATAFAAPPTLDFPAEIPGEVSQFVVVKATTNGKWVQYLPLEPGLSVFPSDLLSDKTVAVVTAAKEGRYKVLAFVGNDEGGKAAITTIVIGKAPVVVNPPGTPPPGTPTPLKIGLVLVRKDGPPSPEVTGVVTSPEWQKLVDSGKYTSVKEVTMSELLRFYTPKAGESFPLPGVLSFIQDETTKKNKIYRKADGSLMAVDLPTGDEGIRNLPNVIK